MASQIATPASIATELTTDDGVCVLTYNPLDTLGIINSVGDDAAGATAVFIGTTRNSFRGTYYVWHADDQTDCEILKADWTLGKVVTRLEYQAYSKLAVKTMADILRAARQSVTRSDHNSASPPVIRCVLHHRLGTVPVGEPSIVIAVSSPHRKEAFQACELILEEVKLKAQIWKREYYEGEREEDADWKANNAP